MIARPPHMQAQAGAARLRGVVVEKETAAPLGGVEVSMIGSAPRAITDDRGEFTLEPVAAGTTVLLFRRLGFRAGSLSIARGADDTAAVRFAMSRFAQELSEVSVKSDGAKLVSARMAGFEERRTRGVGRFITEAEIERKGSFRTSEVLRGVLSIDVRESAGVGMIVVSHRGGKLQPGTGMPVECPIPVVVDGAMRLANLDDILPKDIAGVEIYSGPGTIPQKYQSMSNNTQCGLVLIWTRGASKQR